MSLPERVSRVQNQEQYEKNIESIFLLGITIVAFQI
jgi:hypothetical protein